MNLEILSQHQRGCPRNMGCSHRSARQRDIQAAQARGKHRYSRGKHIHSLVPKVASIPTETQLSFDALAHHSLLLSSFSKAA